jgi:hypothetical protein
MAVHMGSVTLLDTAPSVRELEGALHATCGALVTEDLFEVKRQIRQAIDAIHAALRELRPDEPSMAQAVVFGFVVCPEGTEVSSPPAPSGQLSPGPTATTGQLSPRPTPTSQLSPGPTPVS